MNLSNWQKHESLAERETGLNNFGQFNHNDKNFTKKAFKYFRGIKKNICKLFFVAARM